MGKRKTPKRTRTNPGKIVHRANRIFHGADKMVNLTTLKRDHIYDEEKLIDLFRFLIADPDCGVIKMTYAVQTALDMCHSKIVPFREGVEKGLMIWASEMSRGKETVKL